MAGLETDLIFHHGLDLPEFAAFPLVEDEHGREVLTALLRRLRADRRQGGRGLTLDAPTWRANPDWAAIVGYDAAALDRVNRAAIEFMQGLREKYRSELGLTDVKVGGLHGPRGDGYVAGEDADPDEAAEYHSAQVRSAAAAGADQVTVLTMTGAGEAIGFVRAVRDAGLPAAVGFTVETDGRLPDGTTLRDAIARVDAEAAPDYFLVNCAHPTHVAPGLESDGDASWCRPDRGPAPQRVPDVPRRARRGAGARRGRSGRAGPGRRRPARHAAEPPHRRRLLRHRQPPRRRPLGRLTRPPRPAGQGWTGHPRRPLGCLGWTCFGPRASSSRWKTPRTRSSSSSVA